MQIRKKFIPIITLIFLCIALSSCHLGRFFYFNFANIDDYKKFPQVPVNKGEAVFHFQSAVNNPLPQLIRSFASKQSKSFEDFLQESNTVAFLIVRNDTMVYEYYDDKYDTTSLLTSFSVNKSVVSALVGIAIDEGVIKNEEEPIIKYIPELDSRLSGITIRHLLNMRSGIDYKESYKNPFVDMPKYYYGTHLLKYITKLEPKQEPDKEFEYISVNTLLLSLAVERSTGMPLNEFLEKKLWIPMEMEFDATYNLDSRRNHTIKGFCCLNARARDYAKFGRLYLNKGNWNGMQLISPRWIEKTLVNNDNEGARKDYTYSYQWRRHPSGAFWAQGILGQFIYCNPAKNLIIVRMGKNYGNINWVKLFNNIDTENYDYYRK